MQLQLQLHQFEGPMMFVVCKHDFFRITMWSQRNQARYFNQIGL